MSEWQNALKSTLPELDIETGILYCCGAESIYQQILVKYASNDYTALLEQYYAAKDWLNYKITIHGIKSTSLTIGLAALSESAKALEFAAADSDLSYLNDNHFVFLDKYQAIMKTLNDFLA